MHVINMKVLRYKISVSHNNCIQVLFFYLIMCLLIYFWQSLNETTVSNQKRAINVINLVLVILIDMLILRFKF